MIKNPYFLWIMCFLFFSPAALAQGLEGAPGGGDPQEMQDFSIVGYGARGEKTWEVQGASMEMMGDDVHISDITAHLYGAGENKENMVLTADRGHFDRVSGKVRLQDNVRAVTQNGAELTTSVLDWSQRDQVISSDQKVNISKDNVEAVGTGIEAKPDMKVAKLEHDVIVTMGAQGTPLSEPKSEAPSGKMTITCDGPMELDYEHQVATFEDNVQVTSDGNQGKMVSDKMTVYFDNRTKQIDRIEAVGNVKITRDENTSTSDSAVFTAADKRMVMKGRPQLVLYTEEGGGFSVSP